MSILSHNLVDIVSGYAVTPDEVKLPTAEDIAAGRDVVLAYAASLGGVTLDPLEAGKVFPLEIKKKN